MTDQTTPVTDDDRLAHEWASDASPSWGPRALAAVRAIKTHVPAPPRSLADELRDASARMDTGATAGETHKRLNALADRVEAVEVENVGLRIERDQADYLMQKADRERAEARAAEKAVQRACDDWEAEARKVRGDLDEARAEVERLTDQGDKLSALGDSLNEDLSEARGPQPPQVHPATASASLPDPADVPAGEAWIVEVRGKRGTGVKDGMRLAPWNTVIEDDLCGAVDSSQVTLVARLVPDTRRVIDKAEDLDALPVGSVVLDDNEASSQKVPGGDWEYGHDAEPAGAFLSLCGPVTVIHVPEVTA